MVVSFPALSKAKVVVFRDCPLIGCGARRTYQELILTPLNKHFRFLSLV